MNKWSYNFTSRRGKEQLYLYLLFCATEPLTVSQTNNKNTISRWEKKWASWAQNHNPNTSTCYWDFFWQHTATTPVGLTYLVQSKHAVQRRSRHMGGWNPLSCALYNLLYGYPAINSAIPTALEWEVDGIHPVRSDISLRFQSSISGLIIHSLLERF